MSIHHTTQTVRIPADQLLLEGNLTLPAQTQSLVIFAHGSGSSRFSPRNNFVARALQQENIGTLLFDLLSQEEDMIYKTRFNIDLLTQRLLQATKWLQEQSATKSLALGYFGASTGAAAALKAAATRGPNIRAVVSRGGRPDLAEDDLKRVQSPTLLIVGGNDEVVLQLNRSAYAALQCQKQLKIIPGATHLFEEPGALEAVAQQAITWFKQYLSPA